MNGLKRVFLGLFDSIFVATSSSWVTPHRSRLSFMTGQRKELSWQLQLNGQCQGKGFREDPESLECCWRWPVASGWAWAIMGYPSAAHRALCAFILTQLSRVFQSLEVSQNIWQLIRLCSLWTGAFPKRNSDLSFERKFDFFFFFKLEKLNYTTRYRHGFRVSLFLYCSCTLM